MSTILKDVAVVGSTLGKSLVRNPMELYSSFGPTLNELTFGALGDSFVPERDVGDLTGRVVFVTGGMFSPLFQLMCRDTAD